MATAWPTHFLTAARLGERVRARRAAVLSLVPSLSQISQNKPFPLAFAAEPHCKLKNSNFTEARTIFLLFCSLCQNACQIFVGQAVLTEDLHTTFL